MILRIFISVFLLTGIMPKGYTFENPEREKILELVNLDCELKSNKFRQLLYVDTISPVDIDSVVAIPFGKTSGQHVTSDVKSINAPEILEYDNITSLAQLLSGRVPGLIGSSNLRGLGNALIVIDGVPRPPSSINIEEIEHVTVLKDANAAMLYGVQANKGVILIKTKRGKANTKNITATFETGISIPKRMPNYLGAAEYMELYNEARLNDGLDPLYSIQDIDNTRAGTNPTRYPDVDYYSSYFLKKNKPSSRLVTQFSGGNDNAQYYVNLGWIRTGSLMNIGGEDIHNDRLNIRSNIDIKINEFIKSNIDIAGLFDLRNTPSGNFFNDASYLRPNLFPGLIDTTLISDNDLLGSATLVNDQYLVGGSSLYRTNPFGYLNLGGFNKTKGVGMQFTTGLIFDLKSIIKGLNLKIDVNFDFDNRYNESQTNSYAIYEPSYNDLDELSVTKIGEDRFSGALTIGGTSLNQLLNGMAELNYSREFGKMHALSVSLVTYTDRYSETDLFQPDKHMHIGNRINYIYSNKYLADFGAVLVASPKFVPGSRAAFTPSIGLGWILSEEDFLKNNHIIDFLKLRLSGGIINTDRNLSEYYTYEDVFSSGGGISWDDGQRGNSRTILNNVGNKNLSYEKRKEINIGINGLLLKKSISFDLTFFKEHQTDIIVIPTNSYSAYLGGEVPYENFGENKYSGIELGLNWFKALDQNFDLMIGLSGLIRNSEVVKRDEYWNEDYLFRTGRSLSAIYGLEALGLFKDMQDIENHAFQEFGEVQPGDIKYKDLNNDGVVNADDAGPIGDGSASIIGGLNVRLKYKNLSVFTMLSSQVGGERFYTNSYYWLYGDRKYSKVARNRWTPETAPTATYPRLTSQTSNNNFRASTYWLNNVTFASIDRIQFNFKLPDKLNQKLFTNQLAIFARINSVALFSKSSDKMELNIGSQPQFRSYNIGVKATF